MKRKIYYFYYLITIVLAAGFVYIQTANARIGFTNNTLLPCSKTPSCFLTKKPLHSKKQQKMIPFISKTLKSMQGKIQVTSPNYLYAIFESKFLRFKDDFEVLQIQDTLWIRSSSRIGYSDFGKNKKRVTELLQYLQNL